MRGRTNQQTSMFSVIPIDSWIEEEHPLRSLADLVNPVMERLSPEFDHMYAKVDRPSIPPEQLLKALLQQVLYTIRSEAQLLEYLRFNLLYRRFVGLSPDVCIWDETVFSKNSARLLEGDIAQKFFQAVLELARAGDLVSTDHFSVDGTQIEAWASHKSFQLKEPGGNDDSTSLPPPPSSAGDGGGSNPSVDFRGSTRSNETHESKTNPESRLYKKASGVASKLSFMGHAMMENRNGLVIDARLSEADGTAERDVALGMAFRVSDEHQRKTLGAEMNYDTKTFTGVLKVLDVTPHVAQNHNRNGGSAIDGRTTRHECYAVSQRKRKWIEEIFGWSKTVGPMRRPHLRGRKRLEFWFQFSVAVYNLVRIRNLQAVAA